MTLRAALIWAGIGLLSSSCSKKDELKGDAPPPFASSKPGACSGGGGSVSDAASAAYFPRQAGDYCIDPNGETRSYGESAKGTLETVCTELLDGECEVYKGYGLKRVTTLRYIDGKGSPATVNVIASRFANPEGAYGFFTKRVIADGDPAEGTPSELKAGAQAALGTGIAYVWRGDMVAELTYSNELETPDQIKASSANILPELARVLGDKFPGDALPLPAVRLLPAAQRIPMGLAYAHADALGIAGVGPGALGFYRDGQTRYRVVALARADEDAAKDVIGTLKKLPGSKVQKDLGFDAVRFSTRESEGAPQAEWLAGRAGSSVLLVGDEPLSLKPGSDAGRISEEARLALMKSALAGISSNK